MKTVEDFSIEKLEGEYGPIWIVSPKEQKGSFYADVHYVLRADWKISEIPALKDHSKSVHLDVAYGAEPLKSTTSWRGVYRTEDMDEAVDSLIDDLNRNVKLEQIERIIEFSVAQLIEELESISKAVENFTYTDIDEVMSNVDIAYAALKIKFAEANKEA